MRSSIARSALRFHRCQKNLSKAIATQNNSCVTLLSTSSNTIPQYQTPFHIQINNFSTKPKEQEQQQAVTVTIETPTSTKTPSVLTTLDENFTPGQAWSVLQKHLAGHRKVRLNDFIELCNSSRPQSPKDAQVIKTALLDLKRCNDFKLTVEAAQIAIEGMTRSLTSEAGIDETYDKFLVNAGLYTAGVFNMQAQSGLYIAAQTDVVNESILKVLAKGVDGYVAPEGDESDLNAKAAIAAKGIVDLLVRRVSFPTQSMKKRAKKAYLKERKCSEGPTQETIEMAVKICLKHSDEEEGLKLAKIIIKKFENLPFVSSVDASTQALVDTAEESLASSNQEEADEDASEEEVEEK